MENTDAEQQPTPEQAAIIERLRLMQAEVDAVKTDLVAKLQESREQVDSLFRELSKVRDELIASKTERRVLSRWYEDAKGERDKVQVAVAELEAALKASSNLVHAAENERDKLQDDMAELEADLKAASNLIHAADKDIDELKSAKGEMQNKLAETTKDLAYSRLAVDTMCARDKRFKETGARCGAKDGEDIGDFIERTCAERDKLHSELVEVRSALAAVSQERDSLRITLDSWEKADTKPIVKVEVADHVVPPVVPDIVMVSAFTASADAGETCSCSAHPHPPCSHCQPINDGNPEPDPANDAKDAKLEFRNGIPTKEMIEVCQWWDVVRFEKAIRFKHTDQRPVVWRSAGDYSQDRWKYENCPQPLKPHGMTWQELDKVLADKMQEHANTSCSACGADSEMIGGRLWCSNDKCSTGVIK